MDSRPERGRNAWVFVAAIFGAVLVALGVTGGLLYWYDRKMERRLDVLDTVLSAQMPFVPGRATKQ